MRIISLMAVLCLGMVFELGAQHRLNLNNWFLAGNIGTTFAHTDIRPNGFQDYYRNPFDHWSYSLSPEVSYHFTHGFGLIGSFTWANIRSNERTKFPDGSYYREFNTNLKELKLMAHINLGKALSFNKRKNIISPYLNVGVGSTWGVFKAPLSRVPSEIVRTYLQVDPKRDTTGFQTWNKVFQGGFYIYLTRYIDLDIRYSYTFYNEDYIDGSWPNIIPNREWDKYSSINVGARFKFGKNNKRTYEHTSWAREPMQEDTSLFNNYVEIEEFDDGTGSPVFKIRNRPTNINEEELTKIDTDNSSDDDIFQAVYNTLMENPDLKDSILAALTRDLQNNDAFITRLQDGVCVECPEVEKVVYVDGNGERIVTRDRDRNGGNDPIDDKRGGVGDRDKKIIPPVTNISEFELRDIYYDLDESFIRTDASNSLDELATLLNKYKNLKIELGSHTDCRNSKNYNLALSQRRALAAVNYLVCQGIDRCRLVAKAYGESTLVNKCDCEGEDTGEDCTDEEHQRNRRTTVKILDYDYKPGKGNCQQGVAVDAAAATDAKNNSIEIEAKPIDVKVTKADINAQGINMTPGAGYYIVIGTSYHPAYANSLVVLAKDKENFVNADALYLNDTKYFVYADKSENYQDALAKLKAVRCCTRFPDAWIYGHNKEIPK